MKKIFLAAALMLMGVASASAEYVDFDDLRIYVNPGHGSWTGNDRALQVIGKGEYSSTNTDTTSFFESNTNLIKGFGMLEWFIKMGMPFDRTLNQEGERWEIGAARDLENCIVMSRVKNGPYEESNTTSSPNYEQYNRGLLTIATEVDQNDFDAFVSIHSNATSTDITLINYHLYLYRGRNGRANEAVAGSNDIINACAVHSFDNPHATWTESSPYIYGDVDFFGHGSGSTNSLGYYGYLGVLKHGVPGYLVEGYFHTYTPARHRAMNWDVDRIEGIQYARGLGDYFEFENPEATGEIYGIVRDNHASFSHKLYVPKPSTPDENKPLNNCKVFLWKDGQQIKEYVTDEFYNGAFVFYDLEPGTYQVTFEHPDYFKADPVDVEVVAGKTSYPRFYLTDVNYYGKPGEDLNYPNIVPETYAPADSYQLINTLADHEIAQLQGKTPERMMWVKDHVYVLARDAERQPSILVLDDKTGDVLTSVDLSGCTGDVQNVADFAVSADGILIVGSESYVLFDTTKDGAGTVNYYTWENDANGLPTGQGKLWISTQSSGGQNKGYLGRTFAYRGTMADGDLVITSIAATKNGRINNARFNVVDGVATEVTAGRPLQLLNADYIDDNYNFNVSPIDRYRFIVTGNSEKSGAREYEYSMMNIAALSETPSSVGFNTTGLGFFRYGDHAMMTQATTGALKLYDITRSISSASEISTGVTFAAPATAALSTAYPAVDKDAAGNVTDAYFNIVVLRDNKLSCYTSKGATGVNDVTVDSSLPAVYYDLNGRRVENANLVPGLYIKVQGTQATKVYVK